MSTAVEIKKQILVVEDESLIATDIQRRLQRFGYSVPATVRSGEEALECARSTPFDLVLMDIRLDGSMDGITTAQALKDELETPVVYLTAHSDNDTLNRAKITEPLGYLLKPIADSDLRSVVQIALYKAEMERRLRNSEAWLSTTLRSVGDGIVATNAIGEIVFMNPLAEQLTGWCANEADRRQLMDVVGLSDESTGEPARNPVYDLFAGESRCYSLLSKVGAVTAVEVACFENRAGDDLLGAIVILRDITARRMMESRLIQSQRMEAMAAMAGGLAHDFNNQLMVMGGYADELAKHLSGEDKKDADAIQQAASIASSLTAELLTMSRRDVAVSEVLNVNEVICEVQPLVSRSLGKDRILTTDLGSPVGFVRGARNQLKQVLLNLALNARDAMPAGGELRIESATIDVPLNSPESRLYRTGSYVKLRVSDTGQGMESGTLSRVFEPFFTTKKPGVGTGLGLSIAHSIVTQNGGYISAESELGKGTTFQILWPSIGTFRGKGTNEDLSPTVLLVEDEDGVRRLMHTYLEREGYQLLEAKNAEEAELIAGAYRNSIDLLISDVIMPGITGLELAERLAPGRPNMKVLYISGYRHTAPDRLQGNVLSKPFLASELLRRVSLLTAQEG
jgi:PAS domain S-box-containing protein